MHAGYITQLLLRISMRTCGRGWTHRYKVNLLEFVKLATVPLDMWDIILEKSFNQERKERDIETKVAHDVKCKRGEKKG